MSAPRLFAIALLALLPGIGPVPAQNPPPPPTVPSPPTDKEEALKAAKVLFDENKHDECERKLELARTKPEYDLPPAKIIMARWFFEKKEGGNARIMVEKAAAAEPDHPDVLLLNASFALGEGRLTDALLSCQAAEKAAGDRHWLEAQRTRFLREARLGMAAAYESRGDYDSMKKTLNAILLTDPKNGQVRQRLAVAYFFADDMVNAEKELRQAYADDKTLDPPQLSLAALWLRKAPGREARTPEAIQTEILKFVAQAEQWYKESIKNYGNTNAKVHRAYAKFLMDENKAADAQIYIATAMDLDKKDNKQSLETLTLYAMQLRYLKQYALAAEKFKALMDAQPRDSYAIANLAICLAEDAAAKKDAVNQKKAIELAASVVEKNEKSAEAWAILGWCQYKAGSLDSAEQSYNKSITLSRSTGSLTYDSAYYMAQFLADRKKYKEANDLLKNIVYARGVFVYRGDAQKLYANIAPLVPKN